MIHRSRKIDTLVAYIGHILLRKTKVGEGNVAKIVHQDIFQLQITIDDARMMKVVKRENKFSLEKKNPARVFHHELAA
jgi:hypothetical protein